MLNGTVKWYSTLVLTIWFVSACEYAGNGSRYKAINALIILYFMLRQYYYLVNPSCAMAAQGMKTVYADP